MSAAAAAPPPSRWRNERGPTGHVLGIDISAPMLAQARQVKPAGLPVEFVLADATVYPFEPAGFDLLASRFGVMFFAEPALSFANMRRALRPSGGWPLPAGASRGKIRG